MIQSWSKIAEQFESLGNANKAFPALMNMTHEINSGIGDSLYGWTSMTDLCVVQQSVTYPYEGPYLKYSPLKNGKIEIRSVDTNVKSKQWMRCYPADSEMSGLWKVNWELSWSSKPKT